MWLAFGAALLFHREVLDKGWASFRKLPLIIQITLAFLALPVVVGLWIWHNP